MRKRLVGLVGIVLIVVLGACSLLQSRHPAVGRWESKTGFLTLAEDGYAVVNGASGKWRRVDSKSVIIEVKNPLVPQGNVGLQFVVEGETGLLNGVNGSKQEFRRVG